MDLGKDWAKRGPRCASRSSSEDESVASLDLSLVVSLVMVPQLILAHVHLEFHLKALLIW
jgi:hypothetical protein